MEYKICSRCGKKKPIKEYYKNKRAKDGLQSECKECSNYYVAEWRKNNKEREKEAAIKWIKNNKNKVLDYHKEYRDNNQEYFRNASKKWREENKARDRERSRQWKLNNKDKCRLYSAKRRSVNKGIVTEQEWLDLCNYYGNKCLRCGRKDVLLTIDHIIPIAHGGENIIDNIQPLCGSCNSIKHLKHTDYRIELQNIKDCDKL